MNEKKLYDGYSKCKVIDSSVLSCYTIKIPINMCLARRSFQISKQGSCIRTIDITFAEDNSIKRFLASKFCNGCTITRLLKSNWVGIRIRRRSRRKWCEGSELEIVVLRRVIVVATYIDYMVLE